MTPARVAQFAANVVGLLARPVPIQNAGKNHQRMRVKSIRSFKPARIASFAKLC